MSIGPVWSKGSHFQYSILEQCFDNSVDDGAALKRFADNLRSSTANANVFSERLRLFSGFLDVAQLAKLEKMYIEVAKNWYGDDDHKPMWHRDIRTRPSEIHRITCESEAYLANLLAAGATGCEIFGQCKHHQYETWITCPRSGFVGQKVRLWRASGNDYLYNEATYQRPVSIPTLNDLLTRGLQAVAKDQQTFEQKLAAEVDKAVGFASQVLAAKLDERRARLDESALGSAQIKQLNEEVEDAENTLIIELSRHPDHMYPAFKGNALGVAFDGGLPLIGDVRLEYLEDFLADPREPRLNQPAEEMLEPDGAPADGVRFRWDRSLPGRWGPYPPLKVRLDQARALGLLP